MIQNKGERENRRKKNKAGGKVNGKWIRSETKCMQTEGLESDTLKCHLKNTGHIRTAIEFKTDFASEIVHSEIVIETDGQFILHGFNAFVSLAPSSPLQSPLPPPT